MQRLEPCVILLYFRGKQTSTGVTCYIFEPSLCSGGRMPREPNINIHQHYILLPLPPLSLPFSSTHANFGEFWPFLQTRHDRSVHEFSAVVRRGSYIVPLWNCISVIILSFHMSEPALGDCSPLAPTKVQVGFCYSRREESAKIFVGPTGSGSEIRAGDFTYKVEEWS